MPAARCRSSCSEPSCPEDVPGSSSSVSSSVKRSRSASVNRASSSAASCVPVGIGKSCSMAWVQDAAALVEMMRGNLLGLDLELKQFALLGQSREREVASDQIANCRTDRIRSKQQVQLRMQRMPQEQLDDDLLSTNLRCESPQPRLISIGRNAKHELGPELICKSLLAAVAACPRAAGSSVRGHRPKAQSAHQFASNL